MRIFSNCFEMMSEMGRELSSYGAIVKPKHYQNKDIEGNEDFITKEIICQQYCLTSLKEEEALFVFTNAKEWADAEFKERVSINLSDNNPWNPGEAWKLRKDLWEQFLVNGTFDYTYSERIMDLTLYNKVYTTKLEAVIQLLKDDPDTRKAIINIYGNNSSNYPDSDYLDGSKRIPCSMYYDFLIRENARGEKVLHICYHQRSSDYIQHFGNDVYLAWKLMEYIANEVGIKPGYLYHTIDSLHSYKKDWHYLNMNIGKILHV